MNGTYRTLPRLSALLVLSLAACARVSLAQIAPPLTTLHSFSATDGANPFAGLIQGKDGDLYGTTSQGGAYNGGAVFKITTTGVLTTLYSFSGYPSDGAIPTASLIQGKDGNLYGACADGGAYNCGTVFKLTTSGAHTTLYSFTDGDDGAAPHSSLIQAKDGNLYGTTEGGGSSDTGTVFKITTGGTFTALHSFTGGADGAVPSAGLIQAKDGNLYGTTEAGGASDWGTVFKITTSGALTTLYSFTDGADGGYPRAGLIQGTDGNLYGTCSKGGIYGYGTVFKITTSGALTTLYSFASADGEAPCASLVQGKDGNLYGTCYLGGASDWGTAFKITTSGALTTLYCFTDGADGAESLAGLVQGKDGELYGTTTDGGAHGWGTVFRITMTPVITSFSPASGSSGTTVTLTGVNFTQATAVKFGSTSVGFTVNSDTSLTFTVPAPGPASDKITVVNPFGSGASSKAFTMPPVITSFSPASGPVGTQVTLTGVNFTGIKSAKIGKLAGDYILLSDTTLILVVPTGAVTAKISVVNAYGTGTSAKNFTVTP